MNDMIFDATCPCVTVKTEHRALNRIGTVAQCTVGRYSTFIQDDRSCVFAAHAPTLSSMSQCALQFPGIPFIVSRTSTMQA